MYCNYCRKDLSKEESFYECPACKTQYCSDCGKKSNLKCVVVPNEPEEGDPVMSCGEQLIEVKVN